jgi:hypothetical protein
LEKKFSNLTLIQTSFEGINLWSRGHIQDFFNQPRKVGLLVSFLYATVEKGLELQKTAREASVPRGMRDLDEGDKL